MTRREGWWQTTRRLDGEARRLRWPRRLLQALGLVVGFAGLAGLDWAHGLFPSRAAWVAALVIWMLVFLAGYAYLVAALLARSRPRR